MVRVVFSYKVGSKRGLIVAETFRLTQMFPCGSGHKMCFRDTNPLFKFKISSCYNAGDYSIVNNNCHILKDRT